MNAVEIFSLAFGIVGGGTGIVGLFTLKSRRKKAAAEAESVELDNSQKIVNMWEKLNGELYKEVGQLKRSIDRLTRALNKANECPGAEGCVALKELNKQNEHEK